MLIQQNKYSKMEKKNCIDFFNSHIYSIKILIRNKKSQTSLKIILKK